MPSFWPDIRLAFRAARRTPAATIGLCVTMALAVAGCATAFAVVNAVLWRPFPFPEAARLLHIQGQDAKGGHRLLSAPAWEDWRAGVRGVALAAWSYADFSVLDGDEPETLVGSLVSPEFFEVIGVAPVHGRAFQSMDFNAGERAVILTHRFWTRRFGADPKIVGKSVTLSGPEYMGNMDGSYVVVGIMPRDFWLFASRLDVIVPFTFSTEQRTDRASGIIQHVLGRVRDDRGVQEGAREIESVARRVFARNGTADRVAAAEVLDVRAWHFGDVRSRLVLLLVAAVTVLLLAAVNIAGLLMARMIGRRREFDIRMALGASRVRLMRQIMIEALLFGVTGGLLGAALGVWGIAFVRLQLPLRLLGRIPGEAAAISLDPVVLIALITAVLAVSLLSGLSATLLLLGVGRGQAVLTPHGTGVTAAPQRLRLRAALVTFQIALSAAFVLMTVVLAENQRRLATVDLGVNSRGVFSYWLNPPPSRYPTPAIRAQFFDSVIASLRMTPGVERVSGIDVPFHMDRPRLLVMTDRRTADMSDGVERPTVLPRVATAEYFATMGIGLLRGRGFEATDVEGRPSVALVSRSAAALLWPGEQAIGRTLRPGGPSSNEPWSTVVGIVEDVRHRPYAAALPIVYFPVAQKPPAWLYLTVRTRGEPSAAVSAIPRAVWSVDGAQPLEGPFFASAWVSNPLTGLRLGVIVAWMFATLAVALSVAGLYGLMAHVIGQSTQEIGIRKALGATDRVVTHLFLGRVGLIIAPALAAGMAIVVVILRGIQAEIDGLTLDAVWWLVPACCALFGLVCLAAAYVPLRRIRAIDPIRSLRTE